MKVQNVLTQQRWKVEYILYIFTSSGYNELVKLFSKVCIVPKANICLKRSISVLRGWSHYRLSVVPVFQPPLKLSALQMSVT